MWIQSNVCCPRTTNNNPTGTHGRLREHMGRKDPRIVRPRRDNWAELVTFFRYPALLPKVMYTTNLIEGFNRQLRKVTKSKRQFPHDDALMKMLYLTIWLGVTTQTASNKFTTGFQ